MYVQGLSESAFQLKKKEIHPVNSSILYFTLALLINSDKIVVPANIFGSWFPDLKAPKEWKAAATKYAMPSSGFWSLTKVN